MTKSEFLDLQNKAAASGKTLKAFLQAHPEAIITTPVRQLAK